MLDALDVDQRINSTDARAIVRRDDDFRREVERFGKDPDTVALSVHHDEHRNEWRVDLPDPDGDGELVRAEVSEIGGVVQGVWTGHKIRWRMARGDRGAFGGATNDPLVWWAFSAGFLLLLVHPGRIRSLYTLDLAVLVGFGISHELFREGLIAWSVPLAVPPLVYLVWRFWCLGARFPGRVDGAGALPTRWPPTWLLLGAAILAAGIRYGLHWEDSSVIDVGYAGVIGAERILDGSTPYGTMPDDNPHGDTYGPLNYLLYVPAVLIWPWAGSWDDLQSAHAVAVIADVACALLVSCTAWRWLSARAGALVLAGWMLFPYTMFALNSSSNDALVALAIGGAVAACRRPLIAGALIGAAAMIKFLPLVALGAVTAGPRAGWLRRQALAVAGAAGVIGACLAYAASLDGGLSAFWQATFGFQFDRPSPFSIWGLWDLEVAKRVVQLLVVAAAAALLLWPSARSRLQAAALTVAILAAAQLALEHWFYLYVVWLVHPVLLVLVAMRERIPRPAQAPR